MHYVLSHASGVHLGWRNIKWHWKISFCTHTKWNIQQFLSRPTIKDLILQQRLNTQISQKLSKSQKKSMIRCFLKVILHISPSICIKRYTNTHSTWRKKKKRYCSFACGIISFKTLLQFTVCFQHLPSGFFFLLKYTIKRLHHPCAGGQTTILGDYISKLLSYKGRPIYSKIDLNHWRAVYHDSTIAARYIWVMIFLSCALISASSYLKSSLLKVNYYSESP